MTGEMELCWEEMEGCHGDIAKESDYMCMCVSYDHYQAEMLLSSGPIYQRTLDLNRKQQSHAHPAEFICYVCLQVRLAVCLV